MALRILLGTFDRLWAHVVCAWKHHQFLYDLKHRETDGHIRLRCERCGYTTEGWRAPAFKN
jgi:hypothetical protein